MDDQLRIELEKLVAGEYNTNLTDKALAILAINKLAELV